MARLICIYVYASSQHQKSATLACVAPVMPNIMRWTQIAVKEKHEDMTDCVMCILTTIGRNPPPEFNCYISELLDLQLKSDKCQDLYRKNVIMPFTEYKIAFECVYRRSNVRI